MAAEKLPTLITIHAETPDAEKRWADPIRTAVRELPEIRVVERSATSEDGAVVCFDAQDPALESKVSGVSREGRSLILLCRDGERLPAVYSSGKIDDLLLFPLRPLELLGRLRQHEQHRLWEQMLRMNESLQKVIASLKSDLETAERLQKARLPVRFPDIRGIKVTSRYLAGMRSGGDFIDIAESSDGRQLAFIMTDSSSYGLSSAVVSSLARVASRLSVEQSRSVRELVRVFYEELLSPLGPSDRLSIFYAVYSRREEVMRYLNLGGVRAFRRAAAGKFEMLATHAGALSQGSRHSLASGELLRESSTPLQPGDRFVMLSDGYLELLGGDDAALAFLEEFSGREAADVLNELAFRVKSRLPDPREDLPAQDCTAMVFDLDSKMIRLV